MNLSGITVVTEQKLKVSNHIEWRIAEERTFLDVHWTQNDQIANEEMS